MVRRKRKNPRQEGVGRKGGQRGGITVPDLLLAKMISNNRNRAHREAMIDTMNKPQIT